MITERGFYQGKMLVEKWNWIAALWLLTAAAVHAEDPEILEIGEAAPGFKLAAVNEKEYTLDSFSEAEVLVVVFTANHCPTAQAYEERMKRLAADYAADQMQLIAISSNHPGAVCLEELGYSDLGDSFKEMNIRAEDRNYNFPYLYDGDRQEAAMAYGAVATPHVFIFDRERKLRYRGRFDDMEDPYRRPARTDARNAIEALLAGRKVPVETTRAFGCSIKWKSKMEWRVNLDRRWSERPVTLEMIGQSGLDRLLSNDGDKYRLINFWATWCGPCVIEFPELVKMQRMYGQRNFELVSVSLDRPGQEDRVTSFLEQNEAAFPNYLYSETDKETLFEAVDPQWQGNLPHTILIEPGGKVIYRHSGIIDPLEVKREIIQRIGRYFADDHQRDRDIFDRDNLMAWCIVPFDAADRTPEERAEMLLELGIKKMAYDYRDRHIPLFREEIEVLENRGIDLSAVWLWVDPNNEPLFSRANQQILQIIDETNTRTDLWIGLPAGAFEELPEDRRHSAAVEVIRKVLDRAEELGCTISLYNHGGWFGDPLNQVHIIESIGSEKIGIVYNFHHGHQQIEAFEELLELMLPYLTTINVNGMKAEGPKILPLGEGDRELEMLRMIGESGYDGPIGIIGHTEGKDIRPVLERNLKGLEQLKKQL